MVFGTGRKHAREEDYPAEGKRVPYRLASYQHDLEGRKFKSSNVVYSFWSAVKYVFVISLMMWWLPMFGQMIAGYVGGRRAGSPWKGVAASIIPVVCLYAIMTSFDQGYLPSHAFGIAIAPGAIGAYLSTSVPFLSPYVDFSSDYIGKFVDSLAGASPYGINTYVLTIAFAYVGGVLAQQSRREIEFSSGAVMHNTTVLVHDPSGRGQLVGTPQHHGVLAGLGGALHITHRNNDYEAPNAGFLSRRHDPWSRATTMRYADGYYADADDQYMLPEGEETGYDDLTVARSGGSRHHHHHKGSWQNKQKRRGAPNYSAKPRFDYSQYDPEGDFEGQSAKRRFVRRQRTERRFSVAPNQKSVRRAERMIDAEWSGGHRRSPRYVESYDDGPAQEEETEAIAVPRRKEHHSNPHQWDSI